MKLIVGLGNPGRAYAKHRHNVGFLVVDNIASEHNIRVAKKMFGAVVGEGEIGGKAAMLVKPQSYMNRSGIVVSPLLGYYKCSLEDLVVVHDDIDLALGRLKICLGGGDGGHNGVKSIISELGSPGFYRIRFGVGRPGDDTDPADYVLNPFLKTEREQVNNIVTQCKCAVGDLLEKGLQYTQTKYH